MNNNIDDWLNSLGLDSNPQPLQEILEAVSVPASPVLSEVSPPTIDSSPITQEDLNNILQENGFQEPVYEEAEEIQDNENEEETEEENSWNAMSSSGEEAIQAVQDVNEDYPEHNPDEELVSQDAVEAFNAVADVDTTPSQGVLPLNSPTLLLNNATSRFSGTEWYNEIQKARIILAGLGGIGSWTAIQLARMNPAALFMYDDDIVEQANMSGQLYCQGDIGNAKVNAIANTLSAYTTMGNIYAIQDKFTNESEPGDIMICGFDNMAARKTFFTAWNNHVMSKPEEERSKCVYLDGRLSIDTLQVFCITGDNDWAMAEYVDKYLFSDSEADATVCSLKQTTYLACMIGSVIVNLFTNFVAGILNPIIPYDLPFFTEYDAQNMIFKTIK